MELAVLKKSFVVCQLASDHPIPDWAFKGSFYSVTGSQNELSIVCEESLVPHGVKAERDWKVFQIVGTLDFELTGILASIANPLSEAKISIFAISTFDTDYILIKSQSLQEATDSLSKAGFVINNS